MNERLSGQIVDQGSVADMGSQEPDGDTIRVPMPGGGPPDEPGMDKPDESVNLALKFSAEEQSKMATRVIEDYDEDLKSREEHMRRLTRYYQLYAGVMKVKSWPFQNAANVNVPLLTYAILQVHGRLFDMLIPAKGNIYNSLPTRATDDQEVDRAERTELFANWYLREKVPEYRMSYDATFWQMLIFGSAFRYQWWDATEGRICTDWVSVEDMVVPYSCKIIDPSMRGVPRYTLARKMTLFEIQERGESGEYENTDNIKASSVSGSAGKNDSEFKEAVDDVAGIQRPTERKFLEDEDRHVLEQHRWLRLPKDPARDQNFDGRPHPVIVVVDEATRTVLRVVLREEDDPSDFKKAQGEQKAATDQIVQQIQQQQSMAAPGMPGPAQPEMPALRKVRQREVCFFTHYSCFQGEGFYGLGLGAFLGPLNEAMNTLINQQIDRATVNNAGGGYRSRQARGAQGPLVKEPGNYVEIDAPAGAMKDIIQNWPQVAPDPESRWFIEYIETSANRISGAGDTLSGEPVGSNETARAAMARYEQAQKQISILAGRIMGYMTCDARIIWRLFSVYLDEQEYHDVVDSRGMPRQVRIGREDFVADARVVPTADARLTSHSQRVDEAQGFLQTVISGDGPAELNQNAAIRYAAIQAFLLASDHHEMMELMGPAPGPPQPPPPKEQWNENAGFLRGEDQPTNPADDDAQHLIIQDLFRRDPLGYAKLDPTAAKMFDQHERNHLAQKLEKARAADAQRRQAQRGQPAGPAGAGPSGVAPGAGQPASPEVAQGPGNGPPSNGAGASYPQ